ncbi:MAG: hypothetical protein LBR28_05540 [Bacteroidales bacterium]|jgi:hypothetical protein|nr:hypothetical protein [Bacteroidales bacterium]
MKKLFLILIVVLCFCGYSCSDNVSCSCIIIFDENDYGIVAEDGQIYEEVITDIDEQDCTNNDRNMFSSRMNSIISQFDSLNVWYNLNCEVID